ncbi:4Fe-4S ferredoxin [Marinilabiliaceae bacterium ANBcel2]|nr:4Fe-4S ferredoxin [Marinilabiliaceae bacterium ANBcel2]
MIREIVNINEELCDGCGECIPSCHEGALQMIDGKARLISDLLCDGLGACIGHCPQGAITIEKREAEPYDEVKAIKLIIPKGKNTVIAHLKHLRDHNEKAYIKEAVQYMKANKEDLPFDIDEVITEMHKSEKGDNNMNVSGKGCPGLVEKSINREAVKPGSNLSFSPQQTDSQNRSELRQWPVQMHLINPSSSLFTNSDMILAADCAAFAMGDFHTRLLKNKTLAIACPKLDSGIETYLQKLIALIDTAKINTLSVVIMEVPCCSGLLQLAKAATEKAARKVPLKMIKISSAGDILNNEWI